MRIYRRPEKSSKGDTQGATAARATREGRHVTAGEPSDIENHDWFERGITRPGVYVSRVNVYLARRMFYSRVIACQ